MNKWKQWLTHNLGLKLLSLLLALALWVMVINNENPVETRSYTVSITYQNQEAVAEAGMQVENWTELTGTRVTVRVRGPRISLDRLSAAKEKIAATVDLNRALMASDYSQAISVPVEVSLNVSSSDSLVVDSRTPSAVAVQLEEVQTVELPVTVEVQGEPADGYQLQEPVVSPATVQVTGGTSDVERVAQVTARVTAEDLQDEEVYLVELMAFDSQGNPVNDVTMDPAFAEVTLRSSELRQITLVGAVSGTPATGFVVESVTVDPATVWVTGEAEALEDLDRLELPALDVTGTQANVSRSFLLQSLLPEGVVLAEGSQSTATVTAQLGAAREKTVTLSEENISQDLDLA